MRTWTVKAFQCGKPLPDYRAVLVGDLIKIEQPIRDGWFPAGGGWRVTTLLENPHDFLWIDGGQQWGVSGMLPILQELSEEFGEFRCCGSKYKLGSRCTVCGDKED